MTVPQPARFPATLSPRIRASMLQPSRLSAKASLPLRSANAPHRSTQLHSSGVLRWRPTARFARLKYPGGSEFSTPYAITGLSTPP
jgi:hypothetical protein